MPLVDWLSKKKKEKKRKELVDWGDKVENPPLRLNILAQWRMYTINAKILLY